jgi:hypothetical protein
VILDAGFLISIDRGEESARNLLTALQRSRTPLHTSHPVVAQVWRNGATQARLASFLATVTIHTLDDGRALGQLLALTRTSDVVDAHLVMLAIRRADSVLTGDPDDLNRIAGSLGTGAPTIHAWP